MKRMLSCLSIVCDGHWKRFRFVLSEFICWITSEFQISVVSCVLKGIQLCLDHRKLYFFVAFLFTMYSTTLYPVLLFLYPYSTILQISHGQIRFRLPLSCSICCFLMMILKSFVTFNTYPISKSILED